LHNTQEMQQRVDECISQFKEGYCSPLSLMARRTEEVGALAREVNHYHREKPRKSADQEKTTPESRGDTSLVLTCFANSHYIDLSEAFDISMEKIETRDRHRWTRK